jgi:NTE family protein
MRINAVFEGGGVKAIGLVGAVKAAEDAGYHFAKVAGTSSGSIIAAFLSAGYDATQLEKMIRDAPFREIAKNKPILGIPFVDASLRLIFKLGLHSGHALEKWVEHQLALKGIRTFGDLPENKLRIITSDISSGKMLVIPDDLPDYGIDPHTFKIATAVRMSSSIPIYFQPAVLKRPRRTRNLIVDGGLLSNFPLWLFDREDPTPVNRVPTIGFQFVSDKQHHPQKIHGPISFIKALVTTMVDAHDTRYINKINHFRTIQVPTIGVSTTDFHLSAKKSQMLFASGFAAGQQFFNTFNRNRYFETLKDKNNAVT